MTSSRAKILAEATDEELAGLYYLWETHARPEQLPPTTNWLVWLILAGRGWGKTRTGAEQVREWAALGSHVRIALVARTAADARDVMVEGESGILACCPPWDRPVYEPSKRRLTWPNGAIATTYSGDKPDQLRGPQHHFGWADEPAAWRFPDAWDQLELGMRLGERPLIVATTTPRPTALIKMLVADAGTHVTRGRTNDNADNLSPRFIERMHARYGGTRLGRQELDGEVLDDNPGALWRRADIDASRVVKVPSFSRIIVAVDPSVTSNETSAETGIIVVARGRDGDAYVLADCSVHGTPLDWARAAVAAYHLYDADIIVGEVNNGGDLVETNIRTVEPGVPYRAVRASRGKATRAEPVSSLYEQGRVHHVGAMPELEDQLTDWDPSSGAASPDRLDALVWGVTELDIARANQKRPDSGRARPYRAGTSRGY